MYPNITNKDRRTFSGMVTALDDAVGEVVSALQQNGLYNNTLIVFTADNGGAVTFGGNNYPLRGGKFTVFEGGTRAAAFVHGPMFKTTGVRYDGLSHIVDWFPTLVEAVGSNYSDPTQDGVSQWQSLLSLTFPSNRDEVVYNLDDRDDPVQGRAAIRVGDYKLVAGFPGMYPDWYKPGQVLSPEVANLGSAISYNGVVDWKRITGVTNEQATTEPPTYFYLFNLKDDPTEHNNIYDKHPEIVSNLTARLNAHFSRYVPPNFPPPDPASDPANWGGAWTPGWC